MKANILIVDDELVICQSCEKIFLRAGHDVVYTTSGKQALKMLEENEYDVVFTDLKMIDIGGMEVLQTVKQKYPDTIVVVITGYATIASAVETMRYGAFDYLPKPFTPGEILAVLNRAMEKRMLIKITSEEYNYSDVSGFEGIIGRSPRMQDVYNLINKVAPTDSTVLILGESGTGKDITARAIHNKSKRKDENFFAVDVSTLSSSLIESELFGHTKGAFTGAIAEKQGVFEAADNGTIFLDEIGNLSIEIQSRLLRVLQEKEIIPVGSTTVKKVDVRLIFATNQNLKKLTEEGKFREDLYYRLNVVPLDLVPLRQRGDDIFLLFDYFLGYFSQDMDIEKPQVDEEAKEILLNYKYPGNVRELRNIVQRLILHVDGRITAKEMSNPIILKNHVIIKEETDFENMLNGDILPLKEMERLFRAKYFKYVRSISSSDSSAANKLELAPSNYFRMCKELGLK